ncbi:MAG: hypothetical protein OXC94_08035, partial [Chloroflexi bacterium]|nr:hypothetical protein [Chloroflexota bacterium]
MRVRMGLVAAALVVMVSLFAVACGDDDDGEGAGERGNTVQEIVDRDELNCGVKQTQPGFGFKQPDGSVDGFDVEFCKALAAAVLGDASKVNF